MTSLALNLRIALRNLSRQRRRSLVAISSVAAGILALVVASGFMEWMFLDFREAMIHSQYSHLQITRPAFHEEGHAEPARYLMDQDVIIRAAAAALPMRTLTPRINLTGLVSKGETTQAFIGEGIDPAHDMRDDRGLALVAGRFLDPQDKTEIMLGKGLATLLGASVGDLVVLTVNTPAGGLSAREGRVAGIFTSVSSAYDESAVVVNIAIARALLRQEGAHRWLVYLDDTLETQAAAEHLRAALPAAQFEVRTWDQLAEFYQRAVELLRSQLSVVRAVVIVIILLGIGNTMMMSAMERAGEMGTTLALGYTRRFVLAQFLCEGLLIGIAGGILGLLLSWMAAAGIGALHIEMPPPPGLSRGYLANVLITPALLFQSLIVAIVTTAAATLYPAWRVSRVPIVDALRKNR